MFPYILSGRDRVALRLRSGDRQSASVPNRKVMRPDNIGSGATGRESDMNGADRAE